MGILDFLKKDKESTDAELELPPIPSIDGLDTLGNFPELKTEEMPPLPDTSLPPLPTDIPGALPPRPVQSSISAPKMEFPSYPMMKTTTPKKIGVYEEEQYNYQQDIESYEEQPSIPKTPLPKAPSPKITPPISSDYAYQDNAYTENIPEFPKIPDIPSAELIPDTIPPLEGLPEPPVFTQRPSPTTEKSMRQPEIMPVTAPPIPEIYDYGPAPAEFMPEKRSQRTLPESRGPMFIRTDRFRQIIETIEHVKSKFSEEDNLFSRISDVKNSQDQRYEDFRLGLEDIQRKLLFIDRALFEAK